MGANVGAMKSKLINTFSLLMFGQQPYGKSLTVMSQFNRGLERKVAQIKSVINIQTDGHKVYEAHLLCVCACACVRACVRERNIVRSCLHCYFLDLNL